MCGSAEVGRHCLPPITAIGVRDKARMNDNDARMDLSVNVTTNTRYLLLHHLDYIQCHNQEQDKVDSVSVSE